MVPLRRRSGLPLLALAALALLACDGDSMVAAGGEAICQGYPPVAGSPYVLPYPVGASYSVMTANCDRGHMGTNKYGYDFAMTIGTPLVAMRGGTGPPHVHVHVKPCLETAVFCFSQPFQFVNADPPPEPTGLAPGVTYTALPYDETMGLVEPREAPTPPTAAPGGSPSSAAPAPRGERPRVPPAL